MKSTSGWGFSGNGSNSSGFNGLPGGYREYFGGFDSNGDVGSWWSASESSSQSWTRALQYYDVSVGRHSVNRHFGFSARCVRD